jgi:predicted glycosyltransferase
MDNTFLTADNIEEWTQKHGRPPRILFMVESSNGFGHFNIVNEIAGEAYELGSDVAVASGTFGQQMSTNFNFGDIKKYALPPVVARYTKGTGNVQINPETGEAYSEDIAYQEQRADAVKDIAEEFQPDVIITEMYPFFEPFRDTDLHALKDYYAANPSNSPSFVCLARDIIQNHTTAAHGVKTLNEEFDHVLLRGDPNFYKLEDCQEEWRDITLPFEYMGNVLREMPPVDNRPDNERPVLVFSGGGFHNDEPELFEKAIRSRQYSVTYKDHPWKIVVSSKCPDDVFAKLQQKAKEASPDGKIIVTKPFNSVEFSDDIANCAAAITRCGYNTTFELLACNRPFIVIPRSSEEQILRADILESHGFANQIHPEELAGDVEKSAKVLADGLEAASCNPKRGAVALDFQGAERIASRLTDIACIQRQQNIKGRIAEAATGHGRQPKNRVVGKLLKIPDKRYKTHNTQRCIRVDFTGESLRVLREKYHEVGGQPAHMDSILHLDPRSKELRLLLKRPELIEWSDDGTFVLVPNFTNTDHQQMETAPQTVRNTPGGLAILAWFVHPKQLEGTVFAEAENRADFDKASQSFNYVPSLEPEMQMDRIHERTNIAELEKASNVPYFASILDLKPEHLPWLRNMRETTVNHLKRNYGVTADDHVDLFFHGLISKKTTTLHLHIRVNQGIHPLEENKLFRLDEIIEHFEQGKTIDDLVLHKNAEEGVHYTDYEDDDKIRFIRDIPDVKVSEVESPFYIPSQLVRSASEANRGKQAVGR